VYLIFRRYGVVEGSRWAGGVIDFAEIEADAAKRNELGHNGGPLSHRLAARGILYVNHWEKSIKGLRGREKGDALLFP
jgi:hypothetical protein